jgi:2-dehydropantoate 2-reductase
VAYVRILIFGAGALGTLYAARLAEAGNDVAILARGRRLDDLRLHGARIRLRGTQSTLALPVSVVERVGERPHDLIVVLVRRHQVDDVVRLIASEAGDASDVLMMVNLASGYEAWRAALGSRLMVGFAGAVASFAADGVLEYTISPAVLQPTVIGEPDGPPTERVHRVAEMLGEAGFPVRVRRDMEVWQRCHAAWITPFMLATAAVEGDPERFRDPANVRLWMEATKESLRFMRQAHGPLTPAGLDLVASLPTSWLAALARLAIAPRSVRTSVVATGLDSRSEGLVLAEEIATLAARESKPLPHLDRLRGLAG